MISSLGKKKKEEECEEMYEGFTRQRGHTERLSAVPQNRELSPGISIHADLGGFH